MLPLADAGELALHLQRTDLDPVGAGQAVQLASGAVRAYCKWSITEVTETLSTTGSGTWVLSLPTMLLSDVTAVWVRGVDLGDLTEIPIHWTKAGQLMWSAGWPRFTRIDADCRHGYPPADVPDVLKLVTLELAARTINNPQGLLSATTSTVSRTWAGANQPRLSELDQRLLDPYVI